MHPILERQIKRCFGEHFIIPSQWAGLLHAVSDTYRDHDEDRALLNRSLEISSKEFLENSHLLQESKAKIERQAKDLSFQVADRTRQLDKRVVDLEDARRAMNNLLEDFAKEQKALAEAKATEDMLVKDLEKFKLAVDNTSDQVVITDLDGIVLYGNKSVEINTGYHLEEILGKKAGTLWGKLMPSEYYQKLWDTVKIQKKMFMGEIQNIRKNGQIYTAMISISPVVDKDKNILFFVGNERDVTHEKEIDKAKTEFVSIASHALRTPLTAIDGLISMILDGEYGPINENLTKPLSDINTSSERFIHLVNDILNLSRIQAGRMKYTLSDFSIADVISEVGHLLEPLCAQKGLALVMETIEPTVVQADINKVADVLNNLIGNAIKFTDAGSITISTKVVGDTVEISITDTGIGIAKEDQLKLFGQFQQLESDQGRPIGTGLGLHISKEIVQKMGGALWISASNIGKGSAFVFSLPKSTSVLATKVKEVIQQEAKSHTNQKSDSANTIHLR